MMPFEVLTHESHQDLRVCDVKGAVGHGGWMASPVGVDPRPQGELRFHAAPRRRLTRWSDSPPEQARFRPKIEQKSCEAQS